ncbi:peptide methionine sulfoxide reductase [Methanoregula boonei 6A8]|jgi:peptide-methionine (S)-S-oxide reductase|uniref:Peptide methionine sulfoxide reductase MsrA n=1 Tax=Methanoregula boonei (strain DSM 21154 / JCM 14090 / 6A8) TaxID=456442 RepID=A7IAB3_METB6|nr:peptide-methionine (S)-S-oxide reductase MsrA [Methanoregula boonei]ABS56674.1 peptide methionine sulfoxide reductase [Methanoregula boonei 6A8]
MNFRTSSFAAGCFWGVEDAFRKIPGVVATEVGYAGGPTSNPRYVDVCTGGTGHAKAVRILYDPDVVTYQNLLDTFWSIHDPTQKNRQGPDVGTNYRSVIFYHDREQKESAIQSKEELERSGRFKRPVVTEIIPATVFWRAEEYHQQYHEKHGRAGCRLVGIEK